jgi:hypothetical protein
MANGGATVDRLREFLRGLTPEVRSKLIAELERALVRGESDAALNLVLKELRALFRESRDPAPRYGNAARIFFKPLEPFIVDDAASRRHPGRINRSSLSPLWNFVSRDLLPEQAEEFSEIAGAALLAGDEAKADLAARALQDAAATALIEAFEGADNEKEKRRLFAQVGTPRAEEDASHLMRILKMRDTLSMLADHLPGYIANLADIRLKETKGLIASAAGRDRAIIPYALLTVMRRLAAPWQLIRFAPRHMGSLAEATGGEHSYAVAVSIILTELARLIDELRASLRGDGVAVANLLQNIHDAARGLRVELDPPPESVWARELVGMRKQISDLLQSEIESMPGRVRRLLRPRPSSEIRANSTLDASDVDETDALIGLVAACRNFAGELALNEKTQRSFSDVQQYLDNGAGALLDALRHAGDSDRSFRQSQADAAVRFCTKVFGPDYAAMLTRAAEVAGSSERKGKQSGV